MVEAGFDFSFFLLKRSATESITRTQATAVTTTYYETLVKVLLKGF